MKGMEHMKFRLGILSLTFMSALAISMVPLGRAQENRTKSPDEARVRIQRMEKIADHALIPPVLNTSPLPEYDYDRLDYGMTIGIERAPGGRLWACWVAGGDSPDAFFVLATSDDDGETWSKPRLVLDSHDKKLPRKRSILVGNLWTDPLGRLWLIFDQSMDMFDGRAGVWATICENHDADAVFFQVQDQARDAAGKFDHFPGHCRGQAGASSDAVTYFEEQEARADQIQKIPARVWRNRDGEIIASGKVTDIKNRKVEIRSEDNRDLVVPLGSLSDDDSLLF